MSNRETMTLERVAKLEMAVNLLLEFLADDIEKKLKTQKWEKHLTDQKQWESQLLAGERAMYEADGKRIRSETKQLKINKDKPKMKLNDDIFVDGSFVPHKEPESQPDPVFVDWDDLMKDPIFANTINERGGL